MDAIAYERMGARSKMGKQGGSGSLSAVELVSLAGFSLCISWTFVAFFWLFCDYPAGVPLAVSDLSQLAVFAGIPLGYLALALLGRSEHFNPFSPPLLIFDAACASFLPLAALLTYQGVFVPLALVCVCNVLAGVAGAALTLSWLDVLSRLKTRQYGRFTGFSFAAGAVLFAFVSLADEALQPAFGILYALCSIVLLGYATRHADANDDRAPIEAVGEQWRFTKEIEPSFFAFGIVFALSFVFLFNFGRDHVLIGMLAVIPGALAIAAVSLAGREISITVVQRVLLVLTVLSCVALPFLRDGLQLACACLTVAAWALFKTVNYAFVVKKSVLRRSVPFFRQAPMRLLVSSLGFAVGWAIASVATFVDGAHGEVFTAIRLVMAFVLVVVVMAFFPIGRHHPFDGAEVSEEPDAGMVVALDMGETELFERRCAEVARLYQLSPRETDILGYLAKGRNAAWIQEELTISPHTVKSHIYNIYRKLDIHSQQKLMSFIEEYPLDV